MVHIIMKGKIKPIVFLVVAAVFLFLTIWFGGTINSFFTFIIALVFGLLGVLQLKSSGNGSHNNRKG